MRKLLKEIIFHDQKYIFDGATFDVYRVTDEEAFRKFQAEDDEKIEKYTEKEHRSKIVFNFSNDCNLRCKYCYADGGKYATKCGKMMSREVFDGLLDQLEKDGVERIDIVSFFGGEPLMNYELIQYALPLMKKKFQIGNFEIVTNAWLLTEDKIETFKEYDVRLVISCDGPKEVTDFLRGKGTYAKTMEAYKLAKTMEYANVSMSATFTKKHEEAGYGYADLVKFFEDKGIEATVSRVLSSDESMLPQESLTLAEIKTEIDHDIEKILDKSNVGNINPFLNRVLMSMVYGARSFGFCDELDPRWQVSYDYDGKAYNCFHFWGDEKYALQNKEETVFSVRENNSKENFDNCRECWAKYFCKICTAAVMQGTYALFSEDGTCVDLEIYEYVLQRIIAVREDGLLNELLNNFEECFVTYKV